MKKKIFSLLPIAAIVISAFISASAAGFTKTAAYTVGQFTDVNNGAWYADSVKTAYELGFMNGKSKNAFAPNDNVTAAEVITIASRMNALYYSKTIEPSKSGEKWYDTYVNYAKQNGIIKDGQFASYDESAERYAAAEVFASALPADWYKAQNDVKRIPDVPKTNKYADKLLMLYNAGVVMGNDEYGTFNPTSNIKRSEVSAIIERAAIPEARLKKTLTVADLDDAYYLIDEPGGIKKDTVSVRDSAWNYDNRNLVANVSNLPVDFTDHSTKLPVTVWRDLDDVENGIVTLDMTFCVTGAANGGIYFAITDDNKNDVVRISVESGKILVNAKDTGFAVKDTENIHLKLEADLDAHTSKLYINGKSTGSFDIKNAAAGRFYAGTTESAAEVGFVVSKLYVYANYLVNENFADAEISDDWKLDGTFAVTKTGGQSTGDFTSAYINAKAGSKNTAYKSFGKISGKVVFETLVLIPESANGAVVALNAGTDTVASMTINGSSVVNKNGKVLRNVTNNIWQTLRIEADTAKGTVKYKVNGKDCGTYALDSNNNYADGITISFSPDTDAKMYFDDVKVYLEHEYDDYVPTPVPALSPDYDVMINMCSLWREGSHRGWEAVSAYEDKRLYLGFYDEGIPEVADWEIKYMLEHGIGIQHLCWYSPTVDLQAPIKKPIMSSALHDGFFNAKYSDMMKFCIMWENTKQDVKDLEQFKKYVWNYWAEYYFSDSRYARLDNKALLTVWSHNNFLTAFGGEQGAKAAIDFMREDIKNYGYDGIIILFAEGVNSSSYLKTLQKIGADGAYAYHWSTDGSDASKVISHLENNYNANCVHIVPTASVGFNNIGWDITRKPLATLEEHKKQLDYIKNTYMLKIRAKSDAENWQKRLVDISTWNEYGEGTYVAPAGVHGFGYLDNIRETFVGTKSPDYANVKPTETQLSRLGHLYTGDKITLANYDYVNETDGKEYSAKDVVSVTVDGVKYEPSKKITKHSDGEVYAVAEPRTGFFSLHDFYYEWKPQNKTLYILSKNNTEIVFTIDSDTAIVNGTQKNLPSKVTLYDGLPLLPYKWLMNETGLTLKENGNELTVSVLSKEEQDQQANRKDYEYDFNIDGDFEGWDVRNATAFVKDGKLSGTSTPINGTFDPRMTLTFENGLVAAKYYKIAVRMRADIPDDGKFSARFYFITATDSNYDANKSSAALTETIEEAKEYKEYIFDFSNVAAWNGIIKGIRFDPIELEGSFEIDYIKLIDDPSVPLLKFYNDEKFEIINGDAEDKRLESAFFSSNAKVTIIDDPDKEGNHVYQVISGNGKVWAYFRQKVLLTQGRTYKFSFDVKHLGTTAGDTDIKGGITVNFMFDDTDGKKNHTLAFKVSPSDGWKHCESKYTVKNSSLESVLGEFAMYAEPNNELGCNYLVDNIVVTEVSDGSQSASADLFNATKFEIINGDAEDPKLATAFFSKNADISIIEDADKPGNHVYQVISAEGKVWAYFRQNVLLTNGKTYKFSFDVKHLGTTAGDTDINGGITVNFMFQDKDGQKNHTRAFTVKPSDGWKHCSGQFTVQNATFETGAGEFAMYAEPNNELGCNYLVDNIVVTES